MPDDKRTRLIRSSTSPPAPSGEGRDLGLIDTVAPTQDEPIGLSATITSAPPETGDGVDEPSVDESAPSLARGENIGRYVVLDLLGKGGMGEVYTAYDPELDRRVALKVIHAAVRSGGDPKTARARLIREAQTLAKLSHPNVVAVYDVGELDDHDTSDVYIAMEFVEGTDLRYWLTESDKPLDEILAVFVAAAQGLAAAHDEGLVHRDVKPDNILIGNDGRVRVIDFGIAHQNETSQPDADDLVAKLAARAESRRDGVPEGVAGTLVGTPAYMTPEQFLGSSAGGKSDQFSLCVALFEAVSGQRPFPGKTLPELSANVLENKRRELSIGPSVPSWLAAALEKGLAPEPADRHQDMRALAAALTPPAARNSRALWAMAGLAALVIGGGGLAYSLYGSRAARSCEGAADEISAVWNDSKKAEIEQAFATAGSMMGNETFVRTRAVLDRYSDKWSNARIKACRETAAKEMTASTSEKKLACLERGMRELRAVTSVLTTADTALIEEAVATATSITPVESCSNLSRLIAAAIVPAEIDSRLATVKMLERAGRYKQGLEEAKAAIEWATANNSEIGRARALVWRGRLQSQQRDANAAIESLFEAVRVAESIGDTFASAHAWVYIVYVSGVRQRHRMAGIRWAKHAEIAIKQDGSPLELEGRLLYHVALVDRGLHRYEQALREFRRAAELANETYGAGSLPALTAGTGEAMTLRSLQRLNESVVKYNSVIDGMTALLGADNPRLAAVHSNLGVVLVEFQRYEEGRRHYERALALKISKLGADHPSVLVTQLNMAVLEARLGSFEQARTQIEFVHHARIARFGDNYPQLPSTLQSLASLELKLERMRESEALIRRALDLYLARGEDSREETASTRVTLCRILRRTNRIAEARRSCSRAIETLREKVEDQRTLASALTEAAHVELAAKEISTARKLAEEAFEIRSDHPSEKDDQAHTLLVLASALAADTPERERTIDLIKTAEVLLDACHPGDQVLWRDEIAVIKRRFSL